MKKEIVMSKARKYIKLEYIVEALMVIWMNVAMWNSAFQKNDPRSLKYGGVLTVLLIIYFIVEIREVKYTKHYFIHWLHVFCWCICMMGVTVACIKYTGFMTEHGMLIMAIVVLVEGCFIQAKDVKLNS